MAAYQLGGIIERVRENDLDGNKYLGRYGSMSGQAVASAPRPYDSAAHARGSMTRTEVRFNQPGP